MRSRYDYEGVDSDKAEAVVSGLRDIIADPSKVRVCGLDRAGVCMRCASHLAQLSWHA